MMLSGKSERKYILIWLSTKMRGVFKNAGEFKNWIFVSA